MMENKEILLELQDVNTYFRVQQGTLKAVNGVNLTIHKGETVGLVGESGCGKSTLGKTIMRLYKPDSGKVLYQGRDIWSYKGKEKKSYAKNVQMIFQDPYACLDPLSVVSDIVGEGLKIHKMYSGKELEQRVEELLNMVGLGKEHASRFPHEFSGGQRQRIGIARALSLEPSLIVCDEPISALDVSIQAQVVNLLKKLQKEMGLSYLFITHDLSMVRQISHRIAVMYLGSLVEIADSEDIYLKNYHPYTQALLSAIPIANPEVERKRKRILLEGDVPSPVNLPEGCSFCNRCPKAVDRCKREKPVLREVEKGHMVACHLA
jgi:oligopeptide/dipeptide ABC transporter ATP-binding protein